MYYKQTINSVIGRAIPKVRANGLTREQIEKLKKISEVALALLAVGGILTLTAIAPNIFVAIDKIFLKNHRRKPRHEEKKQIAAKTIYYLRTRKYISMRVTGGDFRVRLTRLGKKRVGNLEFENLTVPLPKKWDRKWWQVAADIPTKKYKSYADLFRRKLKVMNFFPFQRTLWYYPYDPREEIEWIASNLKIVNFVTVMEVSRLDLEDEKRMMGYFRKMKIIK